MHPQLPLLLRKGTGSSGGEHQVVPATGAHQGSAPCREPSALPASATSDSPSKGLLQAQESARETVGDCRPSTASADCPGKGPGADQHQGNERGLSYVPDTTKGRAVFRESPADPEGPLLPPEHQPFSPELPEISSPSPREQEPKVSGYRRVHNLLLAPSPGGVEG